MTCTLKSLYILAFTSLSFTALGAQKTKITKEKLNAFDSSFVLQETSVCQSNKPQDLKAWLAGEIKKVFDVVPQEEQFSAKSWNQNLSLFKINGKDEKGQWIAGSPGTFGEINEKKLRFYTESDSKTLQGEVVDVGNALPKDLSNRTDLENKVWLVSPTRLLPSFLALSLEAKLHKALAILIYENIVVGTVDPMDANTPYALPVIRISELLAQSLKVKTKPEKVELVLETEFPVVEKAAVIYVKAGSRPVMVALRADIQNCSSVGNLLAIMKWTKETNQPVEGTTFVFAPESAHLDSAMGLLAKEITVDSHFNSGKDLVSWIEIDQNPDLIKESKKIIKLALASTPTFQAVVSKEAVGEYKENLKKLEVMSEKDLTVATKLIEIYRTNEALTDLASDIHVLRGIHAFAERGQWNKATTEFKKVHGFDWVSNVSPATFIEYRKLSNDREFTVDPDIWQGLQKGHEHLDEFIANLEKEIDRLTSVMNDKFFKLDKSIEGLRTKSTLTSKEKI
jgi:hypothetical protein